MQNIVHIGMHKTGSTHLQASLWKNRSALRELGVDIPNLGRKGKKFHANLLDLLADDQVHAVQRALISRPDVTHRIISTENLYHANPQMIQRLHSTLGDARVICFLRNPCDHIVSRYKQLVRTKAIEMDLEGFVDLETRRVAELEQLSKPNKIAYYSYDKRIAAWKIEFPDTNVAHYSSDNVFGSFMSIAKLPSASLAGFPKEAKSNTSISAETAVLLARLPGLLGLQNEARRFVAANDALCRQAFAADFRYIPIDLSHFFETFVRYNSMAMERFHFQCRSVEAWPHRIALPDERIVKRIDELRGANSDREALGRTGLRS